VANVSPFLLRLLPADHCVPAKSSFIPAMVFGQGYSLGAPVQSLGVPDRSWVPSENGERKAPVELAREVPAGRKGSRSLLRRRKSANYNTHLLIITLCRRFPEKPNV
jgi:hypothetical protein